MILQIPNITDLKNIDINLTFAQKALKVRKLVCVYIYIYILYIYIYTYIYMASLGFISPPKILVPR